MRICMLNDNFYRSSGITKAIERLASSESFRDVDLYLASCSTVQGKEVPTEEQQIVSQEHFRTFALMRRSRLFPELVRFSHWLRATRCDLIHVHHRRLAVIMHLFSPWLGIPILFTGHLPFPPAAWFRFFVPAHMTGVSPSVVRYLERCTRATSVQLIYNPHRFPAEAPPRPSGPLPRVVAIGRLEPVKGHALLIEAWSRLKRGGLRARLDIIGEGELRPALEQLIAANDLTEDVFLLGFVNDIEQRFASYTFHVLVSEREGFPNVVVEAATHGLPSLVTDVEGSRDTLPPKLDLPNGVRYGDVDALAEALFVWLQSPDLVEADGVRFREYLRALCNQESVGRQYMQLYASMLAAS